MTSPVLDRLNSLVAEGRIESSRDIEAMYGVDVHSFEDWKRLVHPEV